ILVNRYANASIKITILFSVAAAIGLINLLPVMNSVFFKNDSLNGTLSVYMLTVICVSLIMMDIALLQVKNRVKVILFALVIVVICVGLTVSSIKNVSLPNNEKIHCEISGYNDAIIYHSTNSLVSYSRRR